ncbi:MAG TPA: hypothetical protein VFC77_08050 [Myxococcota bacterium]|nr:hypothetical protein [Myxococcota bacterium]
MTLRTTLVALLAAAALASASGCRTIGTLFSTTGDAVGNTAEATGKAAGTAARGAGSIVENTAEAADDEIKGK